MFQGCFKNVSRKYIVLKILLDTNFFGQNIIWAKKKLVKKIGMKKNIDKQLFDKKKIVR